ncbi:MAG: deaminase [Minisyncoccia bacterium]
MLEAHSDFLRKAIEKSRESFHAGNFPAGGVVALDGQEISSAVSSPYPGLFHADSKAVSQAFEKHGVLKGAILYVGLEPCLMCQGVAYWSGIREIYYAVPKQRVSGDYYETHEDTSAITSRFNEPLQMHHIEALENEGLGVIQEWEKSHT